MSLVGQHVESHRDWIQGGGLLGDLEAPSQPLWNAGAPQASAQPPGALGIRALLGGPQVAPGGGAGTGAARQSLGAGLLGCVHMLLCCLLRSGLNYQTYCPHACH